MSRYIPVRKSLGKCSGRPRRTWQCDKIEVEIWLLICEDEGKAVGDQDCAQLDI